MKYKLCFLTCLLAIGMLASCGQQDPVVPNSSNSEPEEKKQLAAPENLRYENGFLKWNVVEFASNYFVSVDGEEYSSSLNSFDLLTINLQSGGHAAMVKSIGNSEYYSSPYSNPITFTYENSNDKPIEVQEPVKTEDVFDQNNAYKVKDTKDKNGDSVLAESFTIYNHDYYIYQIGLIESVPLQENVESKKYNGQTKDTLEFTTTVSTTEAIETTLESVVEDTIKIDKGFEDSISASVGTSFAKLETELKIFSSVSKELTSSHSESVTKAASMTETYSKKVSYTFEPDISPVGHYRHILVGNIVVYFLEVYDHSTKEKLVGTKYSVISSTEICLEYSKDDPTFSRSRFDTIEFIRSNNDLPEIDCDYTEAYDQSIDSLFSDDVLSVLPNLGIMKVNLCSLYSRDEESTIKGIDYEFYSDNVLTIYPLYNGIPINQIIFEGKYNQKDAYGILLDKLVGDLSVDFGGNWDIVPDIVFKNLGLFSSHGESVFDFTKFDSISVTFKGENYIEGRSSSHESIIKGNNINFFGNSNSSLKVLANALSDNYGIKGISATDLTIKGNKTSVTVKGGDAAPGTTDDVDGYTGGTGIDCANLYAEGLLDFTIYGGSGGKGSQGSERAGNGGQGGNGITATANCYIETNELIVAPGKGGDGADGNNGTNGRSAPSDSKENGGSGGKASDGQNGGNGGSTGIGILCDELVINCSESKAIIYQNGAGGKGGNGGRGGNGGHAGSRQNIFGVAAGNGKGGNGGTGGNGGNGGTTGFTGLPYKVNSIDAKNSMQIELVSLDKLSGQAGNGGSGGNGGNTGQTERWGAYQSDAGQAGKGGNSGKTGDVLINELYKSMMDGSLFIADNKATIGHAGSPGMYALGSGSGNVGYSNKTNINGTSGGKGSVIYVA